MTSEAKLADAYAMLAFALTGRIVAGPPLERNADLIAGREAYLPDSGYSRIVVSELTGKARLTDNSRAEVKAAWERSKELVADLERHVATIRRRQGWRPLLAPTRDQLRAALGPCGK